jgi:hypothetical protein
MRAPTSALYLNMIRDSCGYALAPITSTSVYTAPVPNRFKDFWRD